MSGEQRKGKGMQEKSQESVESVKEDLLLSLPLTKDGSIVLLVYDSKRPMKRLRLLREEEEQKRKDRVCNA